MNELAISPHAGRTQNWSRHHLIRYCASMIRSGGVIAYPTEAVWGLGCSPYNKAAVNKILTLKKRAVSKGVILVAASITQFEPFLTQLNQSQRNTLEESWPGHSTWLVPANQHIPEWIKGQHSTVALRVSKHPIVTALCNAVGGPLVSTSANPQGLRAAKTHWQVMRYFGRSPLLDVITCGSVGKHSQASTIKDLSSGQIIRT